MTRGISLSVVTVALAANVASCGGDTAPAQLVGWGGSREGREITVVYEYSSGQVAKSTTITENANSIRVSVLLTADGEYQADSLVACRTFALKEPLGARRVEPANPQETPFPGREDDIARAALAEC